MSLPDSLTVDALARRLGRTNANAVLLGERLEQAFAQAQEPWPSGCGRLLVPEPALVKQDDPDEDGDESDPPGWEDTDTPVEKMINVVGHRALLPDAREITTVEKAGTALTADTDYTLVTRDGVHVRLDLVAKPVACENGRRPPAERWALKVTGRFGLYPLPQSLIDAIYDLAARKFFENEAGYADHAVAGEGATAVAYTRTLPPATYSAFNRFRLPDGILGLL